MLPDRVSNPGPLTYESGALPIALDYGCIGILTFNTTLTKGNNFCEFLFGSLVIIYLFRNREISSF